MRHAVEPLHRTPKLTGDGCGAVAIAAKSVLLQESAGLSIAETATHVIGLEESIGAADRLADDAVQNADRLASHGTALKSPKRPSQKSFHLMRRTRLCPGSPL